jgi:hypothetical protein
MNQVTLRRILYVGLLGLAASTTSGCPGELENPERFLTGAGGGTACPDVESDIFMTKCSEQAGCHSADDMQGMLDLASPDVASRIAGVEGTSNCSNLVLADPGDPGASLLITKLGDNPPCGAQMPFGGGEKLTQAEIDCVEQYIADLPSGSSGPGAGGGGPGSGGMGGSPSGSGGAGGAGGAAGGAGGAGGN